MSKYSDKFIRRVDRVDKYLPDEYDAEDLSNNLSQEDKAKVLRFLIEHTWFVLNDILVNKGIIKAKLKGLIDEL